MAIGYSSKFGTITSLNDLLSPKFKSAVALNGSLTSVHAALNGVMMASLLGEYYAQAINKDAPHPAAARLREEFLYSQAASGGRTSGSRRAPGRWSRPRCNLTAASTPARLNWAKAVG